LQSRYSLIATKKKNSCAQPAKQKQNCNPVMDLPTKRQRSENGLRYAGAKKHIHIILPAGTVRTFGSLAMPFALGAAAAAAVTVAVGRRLYGILDSQPTLHGDPVAKGVTHVLRRNTRGEGVGFRERQNLRTGVGRATPATLDRHGFPMTVEGR